MISKYSVLSSPSFRWYPVDSCGLPGVDAHFKVQATFDAPGTFYTSLLLSYPTEMVQKLIIRIKNP